MKCPNALMFLCLFLIFPLSTPYSSATEVSPSVSAREITLEYRFRQLKRADNQIEASRIESAIWRLWLESGNQQVDQLLQQAIQARRWYDFDRALSLLDQIIGLSPTYSEAWNQRATVHFQRGDFESSLQDIARTLELEPRHFAALAGRGVIRLQQGDSALAIQNIKAALNYHPFLKERSLFPFLMDSFQAP